MVNTITFRKGDTELGTITVDGDDIKAQGAGLDFLRQWEHRAPDTPITEFYEDWSNGYVVSKVSSDDVEKGDRLNRAKAPQKCKYGDHPATKSILHSEGMAYIPVCDLHLSRGKAAAAASVPSGEPDPSNIDRVYAIGKNDKHYPTLERAPGKKDNWVEQTGGLPPYIDKIARHLHYERGMPIGRAIATAVSRCRLWAAGGDGVKADTQAKAAKALAQWEAKKAKARAK